MQSLAKLAFKDGKTADTPAPAATSENTDQPQQDAIYQDAQDPSAPVATKISGAPPDVPEVSTADLSPAHQQDQLAISWTIRQAPDTAGGQDATAEAREPPPVDPDLQPLSRPAAIPPVNLQQVCEHVAYQALARHPAEPLHEAVMPETAPSQTLPAVEGLPKPAIDPGPHAPPLATTGTNGPDHGDPVPAAILNVLQPPLGRCILPLQASPQQSKGHEQEHVPEAAIAAFNDAQVFIEHYASAAHVRGHVKVCRSPEAAPSSSSCLHEKQLAGHDGVLPHADASMDQELILYDPYHGVAFEIQPAIHLCRVLLLQSSFTYPSATFFIGAARKAGNSIAVDSSEIFSLESCETKSLKPFALAGINDIMVQAVYNDVEHHTRMAQEPFNSPHQGSAGKPVEISCERLIYQGQLHADCLVGCVRSNRKRAEKDAASMVFSLHQLITDQLQSNSSCGALLNTNKDQPNRSLD